MDANLEIIKNRSDIELLKIKLNFYIWLAKAILIGVAIIVFLIKFGSR